MKCVTGSQEPEKRRRMFDLALSFIIKTGISIDNFVQFVVLTVMQFM